MKNKDLASQIICKQFWTIILLILGLLISNGVWIWYLNNFEIVASETSEIQIDGENANYQEGTGNNITNN